MRVYGRTDVGGIAYEVVSDTKRIAYTATPEDLLLAKVTAYLDGLGFGDTAGPVTVVIMRGNPSPPVSGVGTLAYAKLPTHNLNPTQGWAAFRVTVP